MSRPSGRQPSALRSVEFITNVSKHAEGSCIVKFGDTHVMCTATVEESVPGWMKNTGKGWITAEYGMLPRATDKRTDREAAKGKQTGRTQEIQRLIGRALRSVVDMQKLGERQVRLDCDVLQADGGTRTAAITGSYVALYQAFQYLQTIGLLKELPFKDSVSAISCGIFQGVPVLDLDYAEDSNADTDANFVLTGNGGIVEIQGTAEKDPFTEAQLHELMALAKAVEPSAAEPRRPAGERTNNIARKAAGSRLSAAIHTSLSPPQSSRPSPSMAKGLRITPEHHASRRGSQNLAQRAHKVQRPSPARPSAAPISEDRAIAFGTTG